MPLVLASTSTYRRALLERLGIPFHCEPPRIDEDDFKQGEATPRVLAELLARAKAESLVGEFPEATIIGSDQVANLDGEILGKPGSHQEAIALLSRLAGRSHQLITALAVHHGGEYWTHTDVTTLRMRPLDRDQIGRYLRADTPMDCAGAYKLEARGITLFERIETEDYTAIVGLPLIALTNLLKRLGYVIP